MKRTPEEHRGRHLVSIRSGGLCETCLTARATDWSHRKRRTQGGTWSPANGLHVCPPCHRVIDSSTPAPHARGWHLRRHEDPLTTPVYLARHGWVLLADDGSTQPCSPREDAA